MLNSLLTAHLSLVFHIVTCRDHLIKNDPLIRTHCFHVSFLQTNNSKVKRGGGGGERERTVHRFGLGCVRRTCDLLAWKGACRPAFSVVSLGFLSLSAYYLSHGCSVARVWDLPVWNSAHYAMSSLGFQASACYFSQCSSVGYTSARPSCVEFCLLCHVVIRFSSFCLLLQSVQQYRPHQCTTFLCGILPTMPCRH